MADRPPPIIATDGVDEEDERPAALDGMPVFRKCEPCIRTHDCEPEANCQRPEVPASAGFAVTCRTTPELRDP